MKKLILNAIQHPLISGSGIIIMGTTLANFINFLFNLFMTRNLPVSDYGNLVIIVSLISLATVPVSSITPAIVNFSAENFANNKFSIISLFYRKMIVYLLLLSAVILLLVLLFSNNIALFFNIEYPSLVMYAGVTVAVIYIGTLNVGLLQAKLSFKFISVSNLISAVAKISFGIFFILMGYGIGGALMAYLISFIIPFLLSFIPLREIFKSSGKENKYKLPIKEVISYGVPSAITILGLNGLISIDQLLVKHLFNSEQAGLYAGLSLVAKVIFFITAPVGTVMYPLIIQKHARNEKYFNTLFMAILIVFLPSLFISIFYFIYPEFALTFFLKKSEYLAVSSQLGIYGIFIAFYSVISLLTYYFLSIKKTSVWVPLLGASLIQGILIYAYHRTFDQIIGISIVISVLLLIYLLIYFKKTS